MDLLNRQPHTGDNPSAVLLDERPEAPIEPGVTGEYSVAGLLEHDAEDLGPEGDAILQEAERNGRIMRQVAAGVAVVALLVIAISLFPDDGSGTGTSTNLVADVARVDVEPPATTNTTLPSTTADLVPYGVVVEPADAMESLVDLVTTSTVPGQWVEPEVQPQSQWVDGGNGVALPDVLLRIRFCESTNNYNAANSYSSARGAYQFLTMSWDWYGHAARYGVASANLATPAQQDEAALLTFQQDGARPWAESRACWDDPNIDSRYLTARPPATTAPPATTTTAPPATETTATTVADSTSTSGDTTTTSIDSSSTTASTTSTTVDSSSTSADS
ncbi:MAG: transglycosylase family protein [Actinomycetota bacterium]